MSKEERKQEHRIACAIYRCRIFSCPVCGMRNGTTQQRWGISSFGIRPENKMSCLVLLLVHYDGKNPINNSKDLKHFTVLSRFVIWTGFSLTLSFAVILHLAHNQCANLFRCSHLLLVRCLTRCSCFSILIIDHPINFKTKRDPDSWAQLREFKCYVVLCALIMIHFANYCNILSVRLLLPRRS